MILNSDLINELIKHELMLHQPAVRQDRHVLDELIHPDFFEIGRSGNTYTKTEIVERLPAEEATARIVAEGFHAAQIAPGVVLLTYQTAQQNSDGALSHRALRASTWLRTETGWQLRYHQGTPIPN
jgi:hypothetical protein